MDTFGIEPQSGQFITTFFLMFDLSLCAIELQISYVGQLNLGSFGIILDTTGQSHQNIRSIWSHSNRGLMKHRLLPEGGITTCTGFVKSEEYLLSRIALIVEARAAQRSTILA